MSEPDFGTDLSLGSDLTPTMVMATGALVLAQAVERRLSTPRGTLIDDPDYGYDLAEVIGDSMTSAEQRAIARRVGQELEKDDRINSCNVRVLLSTADTLQLALDVFTGSGPFRFTVEASKALVLVSERAN